MAGLLYVIGEAGDSTGPVKIGMTFGSGGKVGRGGLNTGNWRVLVPLSKIEVDSDIVRWREWLTHRRLRHRHVRGEWFDVRDLADGSWCSFLDAVWSGTLDDAYDFELAVGGHGVVMVRQPEAPARHFKIECSCGKLIDGGPKVALPTVLKNYATAHLRLDARDPLVAEWRVQAHHQGYSLLSESRRSQLGRVE